MKKITSLLLILLIVLSTGIYAEEEKPIMVQLNGSYIDFDVPPAMVNNRLMVPFRIIAEKIGVSVNFDSDNNKVTATKEDRTITFTIDETSVEIKDKDKVENITLDTPPMIIEDRTLVPLRFIAEATGLCVSWNNYLNTAILIDYSAFVKRIKEESPNLYKTMGMIKLQNNYNSTIIQNYDVSAESKTFGINLHGDSKVSADVKLDGERLSADINMSNSGLANLYTFMFQNRYSSDDDYTVPDFDEPINYKFMLNDKAAYAKSDFILEMVLKDHYYYKYLDNKYKDGLKSKWFIDDNTNISLKSFDELSVDEKLDSLIKGLSCYSFPDFYELLDPYYWGYAFNNYYWQNSIYAYNKLSTVTDLLIKLFSNDKLVLTDNADGSSQITYAINEKTVNSVLLDVISKIEDGKYKEEITGDINQLFEVLHFNIALNASFKDGIVLNSSIEGTIKMDNIPNPYKIKIGTIDAKFNMTSTSSDIGKVKISYADYPSDIFNQDQVDEDAKQAKIKYFTDLGYKVDEYGNVDYRSIK